jgi:hypothetical protein
LQKRKDISFGVKNIGAFRILTPMSARAAEAAPNSCDGKTLARFGSVKENLSNFKQRLFIETTRNIALRRASKAGP